MNQTERLVGGAALHLPHRASKTVASCLDVKRIWVSQGWTQWLLKVGLSDCTLTIDHQQPTYICYLAITNTHLEAGDQSVLCLPCPSIDTSLGSPNRLQVRKDPQRACPNPMVNPLSTPRLLPRISRELRFMILARVRPRSSEVRSGSASFAICRSWQSIGCIFAERGCTRGRKGGLSLRDRPRETNCLFPFPDMRRR